MENIKDEDYMKRLKKYESVFFRKSKLSEYIKEISSLFNGENLSILPFMRNPFGNYSDERVQDFADKLTEALCTYYSFDSNYYDDFGIFFDDIEADQIPRLSEEKKIAYRSFFYCALRDIYDNEVGVFNELAYSQTIASILQAAERFEKFSDFNSLIKNVYYKIQISGSVFITENFLERLIAIYSTSECNPEPFEDYRSIRRFLPITQEEEKLAESLLTPEERKSIEKHKKEQEEFFADEEYYLTDEEEIEEYENYLKNSKKTRNFCDFEKFAEQFRIFIHYQHLLPEKVYFLRLVEGAINILMVDNNVSLLNDDETFYDALSVLKISQRKIAAIRKKNEK